MSVFGKLVCHYNFFDNRNFF